MTEQEQKRQPDNPKGGTRYLPVRHAFGLDISDASLKAVEIEKRGGKYYIVAHSFLSLPPDIIHRGEIRDAKTLGSAIKELLAKATPRPITCKYVITSFPEALVYLHPFEFPKTLTEKQVLSAIPYEAEGEMPIKLSEMYSSIQFHRSRENSHHVVFAAAPKYLIDKYIEVLRTSNLEPVVFGLDSPALVRSLVKPSGDPVVLLDVGAWSSTITVVEREAVHGYVSVPIGGSHLTQLVAEKRTISFSDAEALKLKEGMFNAVGDGKSLLEGKIKMLIGEIEKAIQFHERHSGRPAKDLIISGGTVVAPDFVEFIQKNTRFNVVIGDPTVKYDLKFDSGYNDQGLTDFTTKKESFASTVGLALRGTSSELFENGINLLPQDIKEHYENWSNQFLLAVLSIFSIGAIFAMVFLASYSLAEFLFTNKQVEFEKKMYVGQGQQNQYEKVAAEVILVNQEVGKMDKFQKLRSDIPLVVVPLIQNPPPGIKLTALRINSALKESEPLVVTIKGIAATRANISAYEQLLKAQKSVLSSDMPASNFDQPTNAPFEVTLKVAAPQDDFSKQP